MLDNTISPTPAASVRRLTNLWAIASTSTYTQSNSPALKSKRPIKVSRVKPLAAFLSRLVATVLLIFLARPAWAAITIGDITHDFESAADVTSTAANHAAGNGIFVACATFSVSLPTVTSVTNTAGDTFIFAGARSGSSNTRVEWWYKLASAGNASDVVECHWSTSVDAIIVTIEVAYTGTLSSDTSSTSTAEGTANSFPVQQFSSSGAGIIFYEAMNTTATVYTAPPTPAFTSTGNAAYGTAYRITSGAETNITPTGTGNTTAAWSAVAISITEAAAAGSAGRMTLLGVGP